MILRIIFYILAALSIWYGFMIFRGHSGSHFYLVWWMMGFGLALMGVAVKIDLFKKLPAWLNIGMAVAAGGLLILITVILVIIISYSDNDPKQGLDYIIVLGGQVRADGPSKVLRYRLESAEEYLKENKKTICIVSGGKGSNELSSEASVMKEYLVDKGIEEDRIIMEDKSTTTDENIRFSKDLLPTGVSIGLITNDFHLYRGIYLCKKHGLENVSPIRAGSNPFYRPNNYLREAMAFIKDSLF
ncbi:MAG: YdcF family protein [Lachnospiraceae bacterium]|nr:YdcF family protein [Lachnospiraceae bacterium]